jgi:hypothetical protein
MTSPFLPSPFSYNDSPQGGQPMPMIIAKRAPSDTIDKQYASGYLWLSDLQQGGSGNLYVQSGNSAGLPNWTAVTAGSAGGVSTLSDGSTQVLPIVGNIGLLGTANQITALSNVAAHEIIFSLPANVIFPGSAQTTTTFTVGTDLIVNGTITVTGNETFTGNVTIGGTLTVSGLSTEGALTQVGTTLINASGAATTTIATGGTGALVLGNAVGNTTLTGSFSTLTAAATFAIGTAAQTGTTTIVSSTAANSVLIQNGINVGAQITSINNGATAANSTVNILSGVGTAGVGVLLLGDNKRVTTIDVGNVAPDAARVITIAGGNQAQNDTVTILGGAASAGTQVFNLFSGNSAGATQTINMASGTGAVTLNIGTGITGVKTIHIGDGAAANVITIGSVTGAASLSLLVGTGNFSLDGAATSTYTFAPSVTSGTINFGGTGANTGTATILGGTGAQAINIANSTGVKTISIGGGAAANQISIGTTNTTAALNLKSGSGNVNVTGNLNFVTSGNKILSANVGTVAAAGANSFGSIVLVGGTATVSTTAVTANSLIFLSRQSVGATGANPLGILAVGTIVAGTSFDINANTTANSGTLVVTDVSVVSYMIVN